MSVSRTVSETLIVKYWRDHETGVSIIQGHSKMVPFVPLTIRTIGTASDSVSIATTDVSCIISEIKQCIG